MSLSLIFNRQSKVKFDTKVGVIQLSASVREDHKLESRITSNPIETGSNVNDHIFNESRTVQIEGLISDTPTNIFDSTLELVNNISGIDSPSITSFEIFKKIHDSRETFTLYTGLDIYKNMAIESLDIKRDARTGRALSFTVTLKQLVFVNPINIERSSEDIAENPDRLQEQLPSDIDYGRQFVGPPAPEVVQKTGVIAIDTSSRFSGGVI